MNQAEPKPGPRIPEIGDIVHVGYKRLPREGPGTGAYPAIVLAAETPGDPTSPLTLSIQRPHGNLVMRGVKHAETSMEDRWGWPGPRADGRPR